MCMKTYGGDAGDAVGFKLRTPTAAENLESVPLTLIKLFGRCPASIPSPYKYTLHHNDYYAARGLAL